MRTTRSDSISSLASLSSTTSQPEEETIQIFVTGITGTTIPLTLPPSTTISTLRSLLALRTNTPASTLRLLHSGRHLPAHATLSALSITPNTTLSLSLPLLGGKTPRCAYKQDDPTSKCKEKIQPIVGECGFCGGKFCSKHRLLESHNCTGLEDCKKESHARNAERLNAERTVAIKGV